MSIATVAPSPVRVRLVGLDAARGLAVLLMIGDHLALWAGVPAYRFTLGRLAMPLFFVLAGYLSRRLRWRHLWVALIGVGLPLVVPWIDSPNVLLLWAVGSLIIWLWRQQGLPLWVLLAAALTVEANGWGHMPRAYEPAAMLGLMVCGAMMPASAWGWASRLPRQLAVLGRYPVSVYVGHLLLIEGGLLALRGW